MTDVNDIYLRNRISALEAELATVTADACELKRIADDLAKCAQALTTRNVELEKALNGVREKLAEYLERLLQKRTLPNRWVGEINDIVQAALAPDLLPLNTEGQMYD